MSLKARILALSANAKKSLEHVGRSLRLAWSASPRTCIAVGILTGLSALLPVAIAYAGKIIVDRVVARDVPGTTQWVLVELLVVGVQALVLRGLFLFRSLLGARLGIDVNVMILEKALNLELRHFENAEYYDKLTRARREASTRPVAMVTDTLQLAQNALTLASYVALLLTFSPWAVIGLVVAALPATAVEMRFSNIAFRLRNWRSPEARRLNYVEYVLANDEHAKEVKSFGLGSLLLGRYRDLSETFYREDRSLSVRRSTWAYLFSLLATGAFYACYLLMALAAARGELTLGNLTLYVIAFRQGQQAFQSCLTAVGNMYENNLYLSNLFGFLAIPTAEHVPRQPAARAGSERGEIRFEGVGFRYPGREEWALKDVTLRIPPGRSLALVGQNGAGKTTFIKLLCRLYDPIEGKIFLDGIDLRDWNPDELRERFSIVFQDFNQYQFPFRENVGMGSVAHLDDEPRILRAVDKSGANDILGHLPSGLDTGLGNWFKDGVELSGGQWQRVALSRAFMREEADILILDEPTAALDSEAEHAVFERFRHLTKGRTSLLISHRFPTVRLADHIVVIESGKIIEQGSHDELVRAGGRYARLFSLQAQGYL